MFRIIDSGRVRIIFIKVEKIHNPTGEVVIPYCNYILTSLAQKIAPERNCVVAFKAEMEFRHSFDDGLRVKIVYHTSEEKLAKVENFKEYKRILVSRGMNQRFADAFLTGLFTSDIYERDGYETVRDRLLAADDTFFNETSGICSINDINLMTHPNFINLFITSRAQQKTLNVKRNAYNNGEIQLKYEVYNEETILEHGVVYSMPEKLIYIKVNLSATEFEQMMQLPIYSFKQSGTSFIICMDTVHFHHIYRNLNIRFKFVEPEDDMTVVLNTNPKITDEVLANKTSIIYFYGIICKAALLDFLTVTRGYFQVLKIASLSNRTFYYVKFYLHKTFVSHMYTLFNKYLNVTCTDGDLSSSLLHIHWSDRCCLYLFYHTDFQLNITHLNEVEIAASKINIATFKYLNTTGALDLNVYDETTALTLANTITVEKAFALVSKKNQVKFSHVVDNPLLNCISTRACDSVTSVVDEDRTYPINHHQYISSICNLDYNRLSTNPINGFKF